MYETIPLNLIVRPCWVLDRYTFTIGRPVGAAEEHIYICDLAVNKARKKFSKAKKKYPVCTKPYAFTRFEEELKIVRTSWNTYVYVWR